MATDGEQVRARALARALHALHRAVRPLASAPGPGQARRGHRLGRLCGAQPPAGGTPGGRSRADAPPVPLVQAGGAPVRRRPAAAPQAAAGAPPARAPRAAPGPRGPCFAGFQIPPRFGWACGATAMVRQAAILGDPLDGVDEGARFGPSEPLSQLLPSVIACVAQRPGWCLRLGRNSRPALGGPSPALSRQLERGSRPTGRACRLPLPDAAESSTLSRADNSSATLAGLRLR